MPHSVLLVEGESDRVAVEALAHRLGLALAGVSVVPMDGVTNLGRHLATARVTDAGVVGVLHDIAETTFVDRVVGRFPQRQVARFVCDRDLEDELIRSLGLPRTIEVIEAAGDLTKWTTLLSQPFHRDRPTHLVLRRFFGTTSGRKARYAQLLVDAVDHDRAPRALMDALVAVAPPSRIRW